jgi:hypothetical protein
MFVLLSSPMIGNLVIATLASLFLPGATSSHKCGVRTISSAISSSVFLDELTLPFPLKLPEPRYADDLHHTMTDCCPSQGDGT